MNTILDDFDIESTPTTAKVSHRTPTDEQTEIINLDLTPGQCAKIIAFAGCGKTTTFVDYASKRPTDDMLYLAFNKSVEIEAKTKFGPNVVPKTVHALAWHYAGRKYKNISNGLKVWEIAKNLRLPLYNAAIVRASLENFLNSADMCPLPDHVVPDELQKLKVGYEEDVADLLAALWTGMQNEQIPMTHSGYLKLFQLQKPKLQWPTILLDEAQDTNPVTLALVTDQLKYGTKLILCGDPYQQIYSWRGAVDAMAKVDCKTLRLTKSFRFGKNIADVANKLLSGLLNEKTPIIGTEQKDDNSKKHCIICRTNAGLFISAANQKDFSVTGEPRFLGLLDDLSDIHRLASGRQPKNKIFAFYRSFAELLEKATECLDYELQIKANIVKTYGSELPTMIHRVRDNLVSSDTTNINLVTGHQAKGLEWTQVSLGSDFPDLQTPEGKTKKVTKNAEKNSESELSTEEANLLYVACTRAKRTLNPGSSIERFLKL